ncbi:adenylate kinase [Candidatus Tisiphia endosymbiont of Nemotelus uliginosus]|uniref:adenylate kinase n=1 Tax=Candidatus Tisiphia endosymbiont of Nemotelus uliginosus TaxID=3077926 RepID=UPI0035C91082
MIIALMGPPGSGKGTQGKLLAEKLNLPHISIGDIFRELVEQGDNESQLLQFYMSRGKLVPSELVNNIVQKFVSQKKYEKGYIIDGYPRNVAQAKYFNNLVKQEVKILFFIIEEQTIIKRILGRFSCVNCGQIYNKFFIKLKIENVCDVCGSSQFIHRKDDDESTIKQRIAEYQIETNPLVDYYKNNQQLYSINANKNREDIELAIDKLLKII